MMMSEKLYRELIGALKNLANNVLPDISITVALVAR